MKKIIIKTCSCFLEKAVWFVNSPTRYPYWVFLCGVKDATKTIFVSDELKGLLDFNKIDIVLFGLCEI